jgi:hypothetical protein
MCSRTRLNAREAGRQTATITVRRGSQRKNKDRFAEYTEECILEIADPFKDIAVDLYKLRRDIENRY